MADPKKILIIDDDKGVRLVMSAILKKHNYHTIEATGGYNGIELFRKELPSVVLLDLKMPEIDGIQTLEELMKINPSVPVIMITAYADISTAVKAIKLGAYDFLTKPPQMDKLLLTINRAVEKYELQKELVHLDTTVEVSLERLFGKSEAMKSVIQQMRQVATTDFSVIIQGETGTGKSFIAQSIHDLSHRASKPFQAVDVGVIPENLIESELFGHEKGAFTGADRKKIGFFEIANGGTLFIDELENTPMVLQSKLLRAVEEKRIYAIGNTKPIDIDVRIIAATNTDIRQAIREKKFREDLFFRLSEFVITIPKLRDRVEDIPLLAMKFFNKAALDLNKQMREIDPKAMELLTGYSWPGNVRELKNVIRRAVLLAGGGIVKPENVELQAEEAVYNAGQGPTMPLKEIAAQVTKDAEKQAISRALAAVKGNKTKAASMLEIDYKTLLTKIKEYGLNH